VPSAEGLERLGGVRAAEWGRGRQTLGHERFGSEGSEGGERAFGLVSAGAGDDGGVEGPALGAVAAEGDACGALDAEGTRFEDRDSEQGVGPDLVDGERERIEQGAGDDVDAFLVG
jgi:hypothetical protein